MSRVHRGKGEAWLRGGQTFSHNIDMVMEVLGKLVILSLVWGMVCFWMGNRSSSELEQEYGIQAAQAALFEKFGHPLPEKIAIKGLDGIERTYTNAQIAELDWLQPIAKRYYHNLRKALLMWGLGVFAIFTLATAWFIHSGEEKLRARQIRGQKVVGIADLLRQIYEFNEKKKAAEKDPTYQPAKIVGVPFPYRTESEHLFAVGAPGAGKSQAIHTLLESIRARGDRAIVYDPELDYIRAHYRPETDLILNPYDARSVGWSPFNDATDKTELDKLAACLWKDPKSGDPYWSEASRQTFVWATYQFKRLFPEATLQDLLQMFFGPHELLEWLVRGTPAASHLAGGGNRVTSIKSVMTTGLNSLTHLSADYSTFSIREWVNSRDGEGGILFLSAPETHIESLRPLLSFWTELVVGALLSRPEDNRPQTWIVLDEFSSLGRIDGLATGPVRLRKYNGSMVLGLQQFSQLQEIYGHETATTIIGQCATKLILRCQDPETAKFMSDQLGRAQVRRVDESISFGANSQRDGVNLNAREEIEPVALPEDLMNQPKMHGFIKVSSARDGEAFPAATLKFSFKSRPKVADGIVPPEGPTPTEIFLAELQKTNELIAEAEAKRQKGSEPPAVEATAASAGAPMVIDPKSGLPIAAADTPVVAANDPELPDEDGAEAAAEASDGDPAIITPDEANAPGNAAPVEPISTGDVALPELAAAGNLDRTSRLAVDAYRSRLDLDAKQSAFMQLYDRVRRDMEQGIPLNGLAVWKGKERGPARGAGRPPPTGPWLAQDPDDDRNDLDGPSTSGSMR